MILRYKILDKIQTIVIEPFRVKRNIWEKGINNNKIRLLVVGGYISTKVPLAEIRFLRNTLNFEPVCRQATLNLKL